MTFLKQQCEENIAAFEPVMSLLDKTDEYIRNSDYDRGLPSTRVPTEKKIEIVTHSTALALRKEIEKRLPPEDPRVCYDCAVTENGRQQKNKILTQVLEIIRELVPDDV